MEDETYLICSRCRKKAPINEVRADKTGRDWICLECYDFQHPEKETSEQLISGADVSTIQETAKAEFLNRVERREEQLKIGEAKKYICISCKYKFIRRPDFIGKGCPFCGKITTIREYT